MNEWSVIQGDALTVLCGLETGSVQTCVTSPPYFGLRDYGHDGQLGLEATPDEYVEALVGVFREVRRVLRDDGTLWLNLGDSYNAYNGGVGPGSKLSKTQTEQRPKLATGFGLQVKSLKPKDLLGIPWMVAFALRADGWYLRSDIIWSKPNPMPESVTDRPTKAHEYLFLLSKGPRYFYDAAVIAEASESGEGSRAGYAGYSNRALAMGREPSGNERPGVEAINGASRNKRSVWTVATQPFPGAHFAVFPPKLIEPCIRAGSAERTCGVCRAPWRRVVERSGGLWEQRKANGEPMRQGLDGGAALSGVTPRIGGSASHTVGFEPSCDHKCSMCDGSLVLDPFAGAGTTGVVATRHGRGFVGIELNPEYAEMARQRIRDDAPLLNYSTEAVA